uniref:Putative secreted protein n=1 Tax=Anopheles darlingi TaxID=43151 RepID=A0A2M4D4E7_ANODA
MVALVFLPVRMCMRVCVFYVRLPRPALCTKTSTTTHHIINQFCSSLARSLASLTESALLLLCTIHTRGS